ncbi:PARP-type zinc finger-containing protein C2A9.07c [Grifola frondosa]|uniref:PARP-type zinc finger-containing protein C2A9.07c n=1 Tax=Grifola frondosa TaxID=5627 RepID=A0A1C7MS42_GRIFR|nr:PARP-type zinc finger-containing protein C2A9.07c [Grifola frondosa]
MQRCHGSTISKGELRVGTLTDIKGNTTFFWRHWGCVTPKIISNMKNSFEEADELDGFDELNEGDQEKVQKAWEEGHVADEDIPETARKSAGEEGEEDEDEEEKPKKKKAGGRKKKDAEESDGTPKKGVFKFEYASSGRSKCKETIGKNFFRLGHEIDYRGNKSFAWQHWGCADAKMIASLKASYEEASEVDGFDTLKDGEKDKIARAWEEGEVPEEDRGIGEAVDTGKKKAPARRKKDEGEDGEKPKRARAKKAAKKDEDEEVEEEEEEEKPKKKRAPPKKKAEPKPKAAPRKRAAKKKKSDEESGEDFEDELAAVAEDDDDEEPQEEEGTKKRKRAPASKASASKPSSKRAKPASTRGKKKVQEEILEESDEED